MEPISWLILLGVGFIAYKVAFSGEDTPRSLALQAPGETPGRQKPAEAEPETKTKETVKTPDPNQAVAKDATTAITLERDLAELPKDVRDYVNSFVIDEASTPEDFEEGADALVAGCAPTKVGLSLALGPSPMNATSLGSPVSPTSPIVAPLPAPVTSSPPDTGSELVYASEPYTPFPESPTYEAPVNSEESFPGYKPEADANWCYPIAAARLRRLAIEKRENLVAGVRGIDSPIVQAGLAHRAFSESRPSDATNAIVLSLSDTPPRRGLRSRAERILRSFQTTPTLAQFPFTQTQVAELMTEIEVAYPDSPVLAPLQSIYNALESV